MCNSGPDEQKKCFSGMILNLNHRQNLKLKNDPFFKDFIYFMEELLALG